jgi:hypothetical protein
MLKREPQGFARELVGLEGFSTCESKKAIGSARSLEKRVSHPHTEKLLVVLEFLTGEDDTTRLFSSGDGQRVPRRMSKTSLDAPGPLHEFHIHRNRLPCRAFAGLMGNANLRVAFT